MRYQLISDAMKTSEGQQLYKVVAAGFQRGLNLTNDSVKKVMDASPCYLGSEDHIARIVWMIMNERSA